MKYLLFSIFFAVSLFAKSNDFSIIIHKQFNASLFDITEDYDRGISAVGFSNEFKNNPSASQTYTNAFDYLESVSSSFGTKINIVKLSMSGNIIFNKIAKLSEFSEAVAVVKTPSNGYFIGGYTNNGKLLLAKLDANANLVYFRYFGTKNYDKMNNLILLSDGGVLSVGSSFTSRATTDNMFKTGLGNNDIFLTRFSKDGKMLWSKKFGTKYDDQGIDAVEANDGSILVLSTTYHDQHKDASLMRITENGNRIWLKHYKSTNLLQPKKLIKLRDGNFVATITEYNDMQKEHIRLIKFDLYKNVLIDREITTTYPSGLNDIKEFSDGTFIGVGYVKDTTNTDGLAMIFDSNLAMLRQEHYGSSNYDVFNAVHILHNSQVAVAGVHTNSNSQEQNMWIVKLNRDATMTQLSNNK